MNDFLFRVKLMIYVRPRRKWDALMWKLGEKERNRKGFELWKHNQKQ